MVHFLINRPIAVCMTFIAVVMLGLVAYRQLPISLMPDIDIPEITVQASYTNSSARELENSVTKNLRAQLMQVAHLRDIVSETRDGNVTIRLLFDYGTSIDYAFIEVNEKIDGAMNYLPRDMDRPRVMKASATDLPVFYLNVTLKQKPSQQIGVNTEVDTRFLEMSRFCEQVIRRRIEQLPEVAMVDISGTVNMEVLIIPDRRKIESLGISLDMVEQAIVRNNINPGSILVHDGYYQYQVQFESQLRTTGDIENIYIQLPGRLLQLKEIASVKIQPQNPRGYFLTGNQPGISMAIIQQADSRMADLKASLHKLIDSFEKDYPDLQFETVRDQSELLYFSMSNLQQDLFMGALMAFLILFLFLNDFRAPVLIGITIPLSLIISFMFFHVMNLSINIISLAGLALGIGMIIDCSIIVIENILNYRNEGLSLKEACIRGTSEVIRPMLSSTLSTSAVFLPLIFISGMAGALFYDEAVSVSLGNLASFIVAITILPVLFSLFYREKEKSVEGRKSSRFNLRLSGHLKKINIAGRAEHLYEQCLDWVFRNKAITTIIFAVLVLMSILFFRIIPKEAMPRYKQTETMVSIEWNENIHINENKRRSTELVQKLQPFLNVSNSMLGEQQFLLNRDKEQDYFEAELYLKVKDAGRLDAMKDSLRLLISRLYPMAGVSFKPPENIFERIFADKEPPLLAKVSVLEASQFNADSVISFASQADALVNAPISNRIPLKQNISVRVDHEKLLLYGVEYSTLLQTLNTAFSENNFTTLRSYQQFLPVVLGDEPRMAGDVLTTLKVRNKTGEMIPATALIKVQRDRDIKVITAGQQGEYIPLQYDVEEKQAEVYKPKLKNLVRKKQYPDVQFSGSLMKSRKLIIELSIVLVISLLLLYFILAAQFESLLQPFIVLLELPADITGALLILWLFGSSLNIMSGIGIIIMSGVIINDSILKVDTINQLRKQGLPLMEAIRKGGKLRLGSILMTALTTMLAVIPFFFGTDLGSSLQKPLSLALIGGMIMGTLVSLFFVPLVYWGIYRNEGLKK